MRHEVAKADWFSTSHADNWHEKGQRGQKDQRRFLKVAVLLWWCFYWQCPPQGLLAKKLLKTIGLARFPYLPLIVLFLASPVVCSNFFPSEHSWCILGNNSTRAALLARRTLVSLLNVAGRKELSEPSLRWRVTSWAHQIQSREWLS